MVYCYERVPVHKEYMHIILQLEQKNEINNPSKRSG